MLTVARTAPKAKGIDNRVMYTTGQAVMEMKFMGEEVKIAFGFPLSVSAKNPFFDR